MKRKRLKSVYYSYQTQKNKTAINRSLTESLCILEIKLMNRYKCVEFEIFVVEAHMGKLKGRSII